MFAEWLAGVSPPDAQTINKHVHDMVEVGTHCMGQNQIHLVLYVRLPARLVESKLVRSDGCNKTRTPVL